MLILILIEHPVTTDWFLFCVTKTSCVPKSQNNHVKLKLTDRIYRNILIFEIEKVHRKLTPK